MMDSKRLKGFFYKTFIAIINAGVGVLFASHLFAATLQLGNPTVVLTAGHTIELPLHSSKPISGDLTAKGRFQAGDVSFIPSPKCHLSTHGCTLLITASPASHRYVAVPVVVSESGVSNKPVFALSVIRLGDPAPVNTKLPEIVSTPLMLSDEIGTGLTLTVTNTTSSTLNHLMAVQLPIGVTSSICPTVAPGVSCTLRLLVKDAVEAGDAIISIQSDRGVLQDRILSITAPKVSTQKSVATPSPGPARTLTSGDLIATIIPHSISSAFYTTSSNGPVYQMIEVTNNGVSVTLDVPAISGPDASNFSIDTNSADYVGSPTFCSNAPTLAGGASCRIIIKSTLGDPASAPATATLTMSDNLGDTLTFGLTDTTYVYAGGGFNTLGNANTTEGDLLAQCTAGTCTNALQGTTGNNYASSNVSLGKWINALAVTPTGNLIVGGAFGAIGGATSGASSGTAALLAQCIPGGSMTGNACFNQMGSLSNPYVFNNAYIDAITAPIKISSQNYVVLGGDFKDIRSTSVSDRMLAKCLYPGATSSSTCNSYIGIKVANNAIAALNTLGSTSGAPLVNAGGLFTQIAGSPSTPPSNGTTFARCTSGVSGSCSQFMNPNNSILGMSDDGTNLYVGGTFTQIGDYTDSSGGYPLVSCVLGSSSTCTNALAGSNDANGYIEGLVYSGGNLYVGGNFTTIGGATPVSGGNMLAVCILWGTCSNFVTDTPNSYANGDDWGGGIFGLAVGNQTSIIAN